MTSIVPQEANHAETTNLAASASARIIDIEERVKQRYQYFGLWKPGDGFTLSYDRFHAEVQSLELGPIDPREGQPISLDRIEYTNNTGIPQSYTFKGSKTIERTLSVSVTAGLKMSTELKVGVSVKKILEIGGTKQLEFSLSTTVGASITESQTEGWEWPIAVPPRSRVVGTAMLSNAHVAPKFTADIKMWVDRHPNFDPGYHPLYVGITRDGKTTWYRTSLSNSLAPMTDGFREGRDHNEVFYRCEGQFTGTRGRRVLIRIDQYPIEQRGGAPASSQIFEVGGTEAATTLALPTMEMDAAILSSLAK